jgi:glycosyltransferase involved in cell wall biosynthesis
VITNQDIVCISSIEWEFVWQGHQEIASRLARAGNRILYIENMGVRAPGISDAGRVSERLKNWLRALPTGGVRELAPNLYVSSPLVLPPFGPRWQRQINRRFLLPLVRRTVRVLGMRDVLIWTYLPTDTALDTIEIMRSPRSVLVYYCIADFAQLTTHARQLKVSEQSLSKLSNLIFAQEPGLAAHCRQWSDRVHVFPFGVDLDKFPIKKAEALVTSANPDSHKGIGRLASLPRPLIGYVGGMHRHVDFGLLIEMARARRDWSWVFVGPLQTAVGELEELPNVYLLGQKPHDSLFHYMWAFDVCIVPYVNSLYTATVVPTKINEYLAVGKPVVSTNLPAVCEFNNQHAILQTVANQPDHFLLAIERALAAPADETLIARRRQVASLGSWDTRLEAMSKLIEAELGTLPEHKQATM